MENLQNEKDLLLWKIARKRVNFRRQLVFYIVVNIFLWLIWLLTNGNAYNHGSGIVIPWPLWCTLGWGFGIAFSYYEAYIQRTSAIEKEFEKLKAGN